MSTYTTSLPRSLPLLLSPQQLRNPVQDKIQESFLVFHKANPAVYQKLVELARQVKSSGRARYGIETIFSRMRWDFDIVTASNDGFKLNNSHRSRYARLIMETEPDLKNFFNVRVLTASHKRRQVAK